MMLFADPIAPFRPADFLVRRARLAHEIAGHHAVRRNAFCIEQPILPGDDRDAVDEVAVPIVAVSCLLGQPDEVVGAVRIHEPRPAEWWGSRLCVASHLRGAARLGAELIRFAVSSARAEGCERFLAHVQRRHVGLFERLGWRLLADTTLHGRPHALMQADLARYPALTRSALRHLAPPVS